MQLYALVMFFVFPIGIPVFYYVLLYRSHRAIFPGNADKVVRVVHDQDAGVSRLRVKGDHMTLPGHLTLKRRVLIAALRLRRQAKALARAQMRVGAAWLDGAVYAACLRPVAFYLSTCFLLVHLSSRRAQGALRKPSRAVVLFLLPPPLSSAPGL
jgi:hypothetical protein